MIKSVSKAVLVLAAGLLAAAAFAQKAPATFGEIVATVNGVPIHKSRMLAYAMHAAIRNKTIDDFTIDMKLKDEEFAELKEVVIRREVVLQAAKAQGLDKSKEFTDGFVMAGGDMVMPFAFGKAQRSFPTAAFLKWAMDSEGQELRTDFLANLFMRRHLAEHPPTEEAIHAVYRNYVGSDPKQYRIRDIAVQDEKTAWEVFYRIQANEDMSKVFDKVTPREFREKFPGGDMGWNKASDFGEAGAVIAALPKGAVMQKPLKVGAAWHVIRMEDVRVAPATPEPELRRKIVDRLNDQAADEHAENLRAKAKVE